jgi:DNA-directed RNA polymerase specialized sigma24 family protein
LQNLVGEPIEPNDLPAPGSGRAELAVREAELLSGLEGALATLSADDRLLIRLRFDDDLTAQEIARLVDLPTAQHVYRRINLLLAELRTHLRRRGIESAAP